MLETGDLDNAQARLEESRRLALAAENERNAATIYGKIADILYMRGDLDEALRIRREEELPVNERFADAREKAVIMGRIARILAQQDKLDEAARIHREECLPIVKQLGDIDSKAHVLWELSQIELKRNNQGDAFPLMAEAYAISLKLGRMDFIAAMGAIFGQFVGMGDREKGLEILRRSRDGFRKLGQDGSAEQVAEIIAQVEATDTGNTPPSP